MSLLFWISLFFFMFLSITNFSMQCRLILILAQKVSILTNLVETDKFLFVCIVLKNWWNWEVPNCSLLQNNCIDLWQFHNKFNLFDCLIRTKAQPAIYYMPVKPLTEDEVVHEKLNEEVCLNLQVAFPLILARSWHFPSRLCFLERIHCQISFYRKVPHNLNGFRRKV